MRYRKLYFRLKNFYSKDLWESPKGKFSIAIFSFLRRLVIVTRSFTEDRMMYRAAALTYSTLFSIVPLLAIIFAIAKGFGLKNFIESWIRDKFVAQPELIDTLIGFVNAYLSHTSGGLFLGFGLLLLLWTLINLTSAIENAFNQIWQVQHPRSAFRKVTDYTAIFFLLPVFVVLTAGLSIYIYTTVGELTIGGITFRPAAVLFVKILSALVVCLFFVGLFMFMPNTRVNLSSAIKAGIPTGILFQILQIIYVHSQVWLTSYNAIYGSFAALPLFMLMCQALWVIALYGTIWCYVDQNIANFYYGKSFLKISRRYHDYLCLLIVASICKGFYLKRKPRTAEMLARENKLHIRLVNDVLFELCKIGILLETVGDEKDNRPTYVPALDIHAITASEVLLAIDRDGKELETGQSIHQWQTYLADRKEMYTEQELKIPLFLWDTEMYETAKDGKEDIDNVSSE